MESFSQQPEGYELSFCKGACAASQIEFIDRCNDADILIDIYRRHYNKMICTVKHIFYLKIKMLQPDAQIPDFQGLSPTLNATQSMQLIRDLREKNVSDWIIGNISI